MDSPKIKPSTLEACAFHRACFYKRRGEDVVVTECNALMPSQFNPMENVDFRWSAATTDTHHTFTGRITHYTGFFMN